METKSLLKRINHFLMLAVVMLFIAAVIGSISVSFARNEHAILPQNTAKEELIKRGDYLVNTIGCHDCHSPKIMGLHGPEPDPERLLSGYPSHQPLPKVNREALPSWILFTFDLTSAVGPWGQSFAANLTSDETGIGNWTEEQFFRAIREGKYKGMEGGRPLLPPMPWVVYKNMKDEDIRAIFTYLKTTKPIRNIVPAPVAPGDL